MPKQSNGVSILAIIIVVAVLTMLPIVAGGVFYFLAFQSGSTYRPTAEEKRMAKEIREEFEGKLDENVKVTASFRGRNDLLLSTYVPRLDTTTDSIALTRDIERIAQATVDEQHLDVLHSLEFNSGYHLIRASFRDVDWWADTVSNFPQTGTSSPVRFDQENHEITLGQPAHNYDSAALLSKADCASRARTIRLVIPALRNMQDGELTAKEHIPKCGNVHAFVSAEVSASTPENSVRELARVVKAPVMDELSSAKLNKDGTLAIKVPPDSKRPADVVLADVEKLFKQGVYVE